MLEKGRREKEVGKKRERIGEGREGREGGSPSRPVRRARISIAAKLRTSAGRSCTRTSWREGEGGEENAGKGRGKKIAWRSLLDNRASE